MNRRLFIFNFLSVGLATASIVLTGCMGAQSPKVRMAAITAEPMVTYELTVFRSPTCGCCGLWIEHMEAAGFEMKDEISEEMAAIKQRYGVPANLASCHTAIVADYVIEGHIPAIDVQRLLAAKPDLLGIAAPGMPIGSPGMESGDYVEPYTVFSFREDGAIAAFAEHS